MRQKQQVQGGTYGRGASDRTPHRFFWLVIAYAPIALPAVVTALGVVAVWLLVIGAFRGIYLWPLGLLAVIVTFYAIAQVRPAVLGTTREHRLFNALALAGVLIWIGANVPLTAQDLFVYRDPAIYAVSGQWLTQHSNLVIQPRIAVNDPNIRVDGAASQFGPSGEGALYVQGLHLLPALLGAAGRIGGTDFMLHINVVIGGMALLAVYGLARFFVRPRWAFAAMVLLAISLPMVYLSRDTYTEPLDLLLVAGSLSLVYAAAASRSKALWALAGLAVGACVMCRLDGLLVVAALFGWLSLRLAFTTLRERKQALIETACIVAGCALTVTLALLDLITLSPNYYSDLSDELTKGIVVLVAAIIGGSILVAVRWKRRQAVGWLDRKTRRWRAAAVLALLALISLFFLTRPLWYVGRQATPNPLVAAIQTSEGRSVDSTRTYAEWSAYWIVWYLGPVVALAGIAGIGLVLVKLLRGENYVRLSLLLFVVGAVAVIYLYFPDITPDQIWASRRFLPVVFPGLCIFAAIAADNINWQWFARRNPVVRSMLLGVSSLAIIPPLAITYPLLGVREFYPELDQVKAVCAGLPQHAAVLLIGLNSANMIQPLRTFCRVPAMRVDQPATSDLIAAYQAASQQGNVALAETLGIDRGVLPATDSFTGVDNSYTQIHMSLNHPPRGVAAVQRTILLGRLESNGSIVPLKP